MLKQFTINRLLVLYCAIAFAFFSVDSIIEHWSVLTKEPMSFVPIVFGALGAFFAVNAFVRWKERCIKAFQIVLLVSVAVAVTGLYLHLKEEDDDEKATTEQVEHEKTEKDKPPLAPLAFGGVAVIGFIGTLRKWNAEVVE